MQSIDLVKDLIEAKNEIANVYKWYRTLEVFIKPEEDALIAEKLKE
jgi:hypothetical protein